MPYPLISEYIEAIKSTEDSFKELTNLRPVLDEEGNPVMTSGNFAVVFKMMDERDGKLYAVKCFTKEQEGRAEAYRQIMDELKDVGSPYLISVRYLDKELFVDTKQTKETEFPVLLMDWVEGKTLDKYLRENLDDKYALEMLAYRFSKLAQWLIPQPFAHGDLKPDNILVREDGTLVLVDYDGMYVPAMKGQKARELGSPDFRHPQRTENDFDEHIDDFPLVSILLSLKAISYDSHLFEQYGDTDRLLLSGYNYLNIANCSFLKSITPSKLMDLNTVIGLFIIMLMRECYYRFPLEFLNMSKPLMRYSSPKAYIIIETNELIEDKLFPIYKTERLLYNDHIIAAEQFSWNKNIRKIELPNTINEIGYGAFKGCEYLESVDLPVSLGILPAELFYECISLLKMIIPDNVVTISQKAFYKCTLLYDIKLSNNLTEIWNEAFYKCSSIEKIEIPSKVKRIGKRAFANCSRLKEIEFTGPAPFIANDAFDGCDSINTIYIPSGYYNDYKQYFYENHLIEAPI